MTKKPTQKRTKESDEERSKQIKQISNIVIVDIFLFMFVNYIAPLILVISRNVDFTTVSAEVIVKAILIVVVMGTFDLLLSLSLSIKNVVSETIRVHLSAYIILTVIGIYIYYFKYAKFFNDVNIYSKFALFSIFLLNESLIIYAVIYIVVISILKVLRWFL